VDILNIIGISMMLMALVCGMTLRLVRPQSQRPALLAVSILGAALIALLTPPLWTNWRLARLPWPVESYINGVHNLGAPQPWLFPIFPWAAFAFVGLSAGFLLFSDWSREHTPQSLALFGIGGVLLIAIAYWLDHSPLQVYSVYDYWHTSPNFFLMRVGLLLTIAFLSYAWCQWGLGARGFSPLIQLGQTSLLVYWVHIEFVYGRFSILPRRANDIRTSSLGLLTIFLMMLTLSLLRMRVDWRALWNRNFARVPERNENLVEKRHHPTELSS
jgi:hypothetical protein